MATTLEKAETAIKDRLGEIDSEERRLRRALESLNGSGSPRKRSSRKPATTKRAPRGQRRAQVISHLESNPGARPAEIARAIEASPNQVHGIVRKLRDEKLVRKSGKGYKLRPAEKS